MCSRILDFLSNTPQVVKINTQTSEPITLSTGAPQVCVLSPLLYTLLTHNCIAKHQSIASGSLQMIPQLWGSSATMTLRSIQARTSRLRSSFFPKDMRTATSNCEHTAHMFSVHVTCSIYLILFTLLYYCPYSLLSFSPRQCPCTACCRVISWRNCVHAVC